jgi:hypothetical protein
MDQEAFNMSIRKFLKSVGVQSQHEIETAIARALAAGKLKGNESLAAKMTLTIERAGVAYTVEGSINLE